MPGGCRVKLPVPLDLLAAQKEREGKKIYNEDCGFQDVIKLDQTRIRCPRARPILFLCQCVVDPALNGQSILHHPLHQRNTAIVPVARPSATKYSEVFISQSVSQAVSQSVSGIVSSSASQ